MACASCESKSSWNACGQALLSMVPEQHKSTRGRGHEHASVVRTVVLISMGDEAGPELLSEAVPHHASNLGTRGSDKRVPPFLCKAIAKPGAVERLSV